MGRDKALIPFNGATLIKHVLQRLSPLTDDLIIISPHGDEINSIGYTIYPDLVPDKGPLMGLYTGLHYAKHGIVAVVACDMPFVNPALIKEEVLSLDANHCDVVIPIVNGKAEPLHAVYRRESCLDAIERGLKAGMKRLIEWHPMVKVCEMGEAEIKIYDPRGRAFFNINTPDDLLAAEAILKMDDASS